MCKLFFINLLLCHYIIIIIVIFEIKNGLLTCFLSFLGCHLPGSFSCLRCSEWISSIFMICTMLVLMWTFLQWPHFIHAQTKHVSCKFCVIVNLLLLLACKSVIVSVNFVALSLCNLFNVCSKYMIMKRLQNIIIIIIIIMENFINSENNKFDNNSNSWIVK